MIINKFKILNNIQIELIEYFNTKKICRHISYCAAYLIEGIKDTISNQQSTFKYVNQNNNYLNI